MVRLLSEAYAGDNRNQLLAQVTGTDPIQAYRYLKLWIMGLQLNGSNGYSNDLLTGLINKLSAEDKVQADLWAQNAYQNYFNSSPNTSTSSNICPAN
jgi:hypothetical protein